MKIFSILVLAFFCISCSLFSVAKMEGKINYAVNVDSMITFETLNDSLIKLKYYVTFYADGILTPVFYRNYTEEIIDTANIFYLNKTKHWDTSLPMNSGYIYKVDSTFKKLNNLNSNRVFLSDNGFDRYSEVFDVLFRKNYNTKRDTILIPPENSILIFTDEFSDLAIGVYFGHHSTEVYPFWVYANKKKVSDIIYFKPIVSLFF